VMGLRA